MRRAATKRDWGGPALLGLLCLVAPAGLPAPLLFLFLLLALMVLGEAT